MMFDVTQDKGYLFVSEVILKAVLLVYQKRHKTPVFWMLLKLVSSAFKQYPSFLTFLTPWFNGKLEEYHSK